MRPQVQALGNLTKTPELSRTKNGIATCAFTLACNGSKDEAIFIWCRAYRETAENICKYLSKGSPLLVVGELGQYVSDKDKQSHTYLDVIKVQFAGGRRHEGEPPVNENKFKDVSESESQDMNDEDGPF